MIETDRRYCGGKTSSGEPCRKPPGPNGRCHLHGGRALRGIASPTYKHGRYSKDLPTRLLGRYQDALSDPQLLSVGEDIALITSMITETLSKLDTGESGARWRSVWTAYAAFRSARAGNDPEQIVKTLAVLSQSIEQGYADFAAREDVRSLIDQRARLVATEQRLEQTMSVNQFMLLAGAIVAELRDACERYITDPQERRRVLNATGQGIGRLLSRTDPGGTAGRGEDL